jgi:hypothetical protein
MIKKHKISDRLVSDFHFWISDLSVSFVSDFGLRISDFGRNGGARERPERPVTRQRIGGRCGMHGDEQKGDSGKAGQQPHLQLLRTGRILKE